MLEKEGVVFDDDGKIDIGCFVCVSVVSSIASAVSSTTAQGNKKRKAETIIHQMQSRRRLNQSTLLILLPHNQQLQYPKIY